MLVTNFLETCKHYTNFEIWDVENIDAFLKGNTVLIEIFEKKYKILSDDFKKKRAEIPDSDMEIMEKLLSQIGDKHFFIFTLHDQNHLQLVQMQKQKIMNFGIDIEKINQHHVFIVIMDKKVEYSTIS